MDAEDLKPSVVIWHTNVQLPVEASETSQRGINGVGPVRGRNDHHLRPRRWVFAVLFKNPTCFPCFGFVLCHMSSTSIITLSTIRALSHAKSSKLSKCVKCLHVYLYIYIYIIYTYNVYIYSDIYIWIHECAKCQHVDSYSLCRFPHLATALDAIHQCQEL